MTKIKWRWAFVCIACLGMSGSSSVAIEGPYYRLVIESPRMIFDNGEGEKEWHDDWVRQHDTLRAVLKPILEDFFQQRIVATAGHSLQLLPHDATRKQLVPGLEHSYDYSVALKQGQPYRVVIDLQLPVDGMAGLSLCFNAPPTPADLAAIRQEIQPRLATAIAQARKR